MTVAAVAFTCSRKLIGPSVYFSITDHTTVVSLLVASLATTTIGYGCVWRWNKLPFPGQPGHGLLILQCLSLVQLIVGACFYSYYFSADILQSSLVLNDLPATARWFLSYSWYLWAAVDLLVLLIICQKLTGSFRWRSFYYLFVGVRLLLLLLSVLSSSVWYVASTQIFLTWGMWLVYGLDVMLCSYCCAVVVGDWRERESYHWSHWCGVICFLIAEFAALGFGIWQEIAEDDWYSYPPQNPQQAVPRN